jgi:hypothetical protein
MALGVPGFVRIGAVIAGCALVAACTPEPGPTTTPTPAPPTTVSPTPSATPTETEIERQQRLDWEAAERAYRASIAESNRLHQQGGMEPISSTLRSVATGKYLQLEADSLAFLRARGWKYRGGIAIVGVSKSGGWQASRLTLTSCEDNSALTVVDQRGKDVTPKSRTDYVQTLTAVKRGSGWKISDVSSEKIQNARDNAECLK